MYGISLFSGYGGIDLALRDYVRPLIYCDIEKYAQGILLSRMEDHSIHFAPIWTDVTTLDGKQFKGLVDIIYGGFPCQDLSVAGKGKGLAGERSGLFYEVLRLCQEASPTFIFLENVPAIRTRGSIQVQEALASIGYDARWGTLSAAEVGANHRRERWFCLAIKRDVANTPCSYDRSNFSPESIGQVQQSGIGIEQAIVAHTSSKRRQQESRCSYGNEGQNEGWSAQEDHITQCNGEGNQSREVSGAMANTISTRPEGHERSEEHPGEDQSGQEMAQGSTTECSDDCRVPETDLSNTNMQGQCREATSTSQENYEGIREDYWWTVPSATNSDWWSIEPRVGRVANGVKDRAHRIKALGNGVVPLQVKTAFEILIGIKKGNN